MELTEESNDDGLDALPAAWGQRCGNGLADTIPVSQLT